MQHDVSLMKPFEEYMIGMKGGKGNKYVKDVARYLYFCDHTHVDWHFIGNAKKIEIYIRYFLRKTTAQAKTLAGYLQSINFASKFVDIHMDIPIDKVASTIFSLNKMLREMSHEREAYIQEKMDDIPEFSEISKMRNNQNIEKFRTYVTTIYNKYDEAHNDEEKMKSINKMIDWSTDWLASTLCLESMQRPGNNFITYLFCF